MEREEVIAKLALQEFERKEKLRMQIYDPAYRYHFRGRSIGPLLLLLLSAYMLILSRGKEPTIFIITGFIVAFSEINRQRERFNALVKLIEIEKEEKKSEQKDFADREECGGKS